MVYIQRLSFIFLILISLPSHAALSEQETVNSVTVRPGITQAFLINHVKNPDAVAVLFAGYGGYLKITADGIQQPSKNFLVRTRQLFTANNIMTVVVDTPSDYAGVDGILGWRASATHASDLQIIIQYLRQTYQRPVWLVGTSRGTISAANAASRLSPMLIDGLVLTATVVEPGGRNSGYVGDVALEKITQPVLIVHHEEDDCVVCDFYSAKRLPGELTGAKKVGFKSFTGGSPAQSGSCGPLSEHGFFGLEDKVIAYISQWIKDNTTN